MTDATPVPGGYTDGRAALAALVQASEYEAIVRDALARSESMISSLKALLNCIECDRQDALRAIDLFAEIAPASLGVNTSIRSSDDARDVEISLTAIELEVKDILTRQKEQR